MNKLELNEIPGYIVRKAKELGADDVACRTERGVKRQVRFANNQVTASKVYENIMADVFLTWKKRVVNCTLYDMETLDGSLNDMMSLAKATSENRDYGGLAEGRFRYSRAAFDRSIVKLSPEKIMDYVEEGINGALGAGAGRAAGTIYVNHSESSLATSNGVECGDEGAYIEISLRAFAAKDASGHGVSCSTALRDFAPANAGKKAGEIAKLALKPKEGKPGKYTVLWEPISIANFIDLTGAFSSAFYVDSGLSFLRDKLEKRVASDKVSVHDDGRMPEGLHSRTCDDEGVPTRRTTIIDKGILKSYLHNASTAKKYDAETTGNAGLIVPRPWNVAFEKGDFTREELLEQVGDGLMITNLWYTRFQNYSTGDFSTIPRDGIFVIKKGEITGAVKNLRVTENMLRVLQSISAVGKEQFQIHWWEVGTPVFMPYVVVKDVNVTKSTQ